MIEIINRILSTAYTWNDIIGLPRFYGLEQGQEYIYAIVLFMCFYSYGSFPTEKRDKRRGLSDVYLPVWARRILFLGTKNPYRKKTIIWQTILVSNMLWTFVSMLFITEQGVRALFLGFHLLVMLFLAFVYDISFKSSI